MSRFEEQKKKVEGGDTNPFTMYYGQLLHQGNMLQDQVRTGRYQQAIFDNVADFRGKVVLDVGTGTGILSFFAAQAGAKKVYAVELSDAANIAETLAKSNGFGDIVQVIRGKVEEITLPEKVDIIVSEPLGFLLVHERMLESYVAARDRFLKPRGNMFPTTGDIVFGPITDEAIHNEQAAKAAFWENKNFFNIDLSAVSDEAYQEFYTQAIVGFFPSSALLSSSRTVHKVDFLRVSREELLSFEIPFSFRIDKTAVCHGFGCWFDVNFIGSTVNVELSTGPDHPGTHWYQCRLLLREPIAVNKNQSISGSMLFEVNDKFSYCVTVRVQLDGTDVYTENKINLHDQMYHYLNSPAPAATADATSY
ncbi:unnamed protein product [Ectocarpus fasciculatus]